MGRNLLGHAEALAQLGAPSHTKLMPTSVNNITMNVVVVVLVVVVL